MDIWTSNRWKYIISPDMRKGLRLRFDKGVDEEVKEACLSFANWLREQYCFPVRVPIYFKNTSYLRTVDKEGAYATFFRPDSYNVEPYIRIAVGDYENLKKDWGRENAICAYLADMAHELTHYYQWINDIKLTRIGEERQATVYKDRIVSSYLEEFDV